MDHVHRQQKTTREKLKALGPKKLRVTLTDYLKSPVPAVDRRTPVVMYLESFCQSLDVEEEDPSSFLDMLNQENINLWNLDSHPMETMDHPVWDMDANVWLDNLIAELNESSPLETLENNVDFSDLVEGINPEDWEHVWNDVLDHFDVHLFFS